MQTLSCCQPSTPFICHLCPAGCGIRQAAGHPGQQVAQPAIPYANLSLLQTVTSLILYLSPAGCGIRQAAEHPGQQVAQPAISDANPSLLHTLNLVILSSIPVLQAVAFGKLQGILDSKPLNLPLLMQTLSCCKP
jgi:hypothetical protein